MKGKVIIIIIAAIAFLLPYFGCGYLYHWYNSKVEEQRRAAVIVIDKRELKLHLYDYNGDQLLELPVALGKASGNKEKEGDMRTPEGTFRVNSIEDASSWKHDFGDGKGEIRNAYGPTFIRLVTPGHKGIGIHGTHLPNSIGTRATEGCIRLRNDDLEKLVPLCYPGMIVVITPD